MEYTDLEDDQPNAPGIYNVKIKTTAGEIKCKAEWFPGTGFVPIDHNLEPEEYVFSWEKY